MANDSLLMRSIGACTASALFGGVIAYKLFKRMDPLYEDKENEKKKVVEIMTALKLDPKLTKLTSHETHIASLISPFDTGVNIEEVFGCATVLEQLQKNVILPIRLMAAKVTVPSSMYSPSKGVLLYGPPGCGKTTIARALAKEIDAFFIKFDLSVLNDTFYGETAKLTKALFTLAAKIQPCVIYIDEIDSLLRSPQQQHGNTIVMKTQFMALWDEFVGANNTLIVIGDTTRLQDVDEAILCRLPLKIHIPKPNLEAREKILREILSKENLIDDFNFAKVAQETEAMSVSELEEVVRHACLTRYEDAVSCIITSDFQTSRSDEGRTIDTLKLSHGEVIQALNDYKLFTMESFAGGSVMTEEVIPVR